MMVMSFLTRYRLYNEPAICQAAVASKARLHYTALVKVAAKRLLQALRTHSNSVLHALLILIIYSSLHALVDFELFRLICWSSMIYITDHKTCLETHQSPPSPSPPPNHLNEFRRVGWGWRKGGRRRVNGEKGVFVFCPLSNEFGGDYCMDVREGSNAPFVRWKDVKLRLSLSEVHDVM